MIDLARNIIETQPILTAFLAIGLGYLVGQISIGAFSLGVGAVLFATGAWRICTEGADHRAHRPDRSDYVLIWNWNSLWAAVLEGMRGVGRMYNLLALIACIAGLLVALGLGQLYDIKIGHTLGIYAGSMTSTATLRWPSTS